MPALMNEAGLITVNTKKFRKLVEIIGTKTEKKKSNEEVKGKKSEPNRKRKSERKFSRSSNDQCLQGQRPRL